MKVKIAVIGMVVGAILMGLYSYLGDRMKPFSMLPEGEQSAFVCMDYGMRKFMPDVHTYRYLGTHGEQIIPEDIWFSQVFVRAEKKRVIFNCMTIFKNGKWEVKLAEPYYGA